MANRYDALIAKESNGKTYWTKIGVMFENKSGKGFNLLLDAIPASVDGQYRISLFEPNNNNNSGGGSSGNSGGGYSSGGSSGSNGGFNRPGANRGQSQEAPMDDDIPF